MKNGKLLTFEGIDHSGKSVQIERLANSLRRGGHDLVILREPGGTDLSERIRDVLLASPRGSVGPVAELFLYEAARAQLVETVIRPARREGKVILCDRFYDSSVAYQGYGRGLDLGMVQELNGFATGGMTPDLSILIDLTPEVALARRRDAQQHPDRMEQETLDFHNRVRDGYLKIARAEHDRFVVVDGDRAVAEIETDIYRHVTQVLSSDSETE